MDYTGDCPTGLSLCGGTCVNTLSSHSHCGMCNNECQPFEVCSDGACLLECPPGEVACSDECVDVNSDISNCGGCGKVCDAGLNAEPVCRSGTCSSVCTTGWTDTDDDGDCETCVPTSDDETCNGIDDNCDGNVDEGFDCQMGDTVECTTTCDSTGTGACSPDCTVPDPVSCIPPSELCNGIDDDCDGTADNGFNCSIGENETGGSCGAGGHEERTCLEDCNWGAWDCIDEGDCTPGNTRPCGNCGTQACTDGAVWGECLSEGECASGASESQPCGNCGTQSRTCTESCTWGSWGSCSECSGCCDADNVCQAGNIDSACGTGGEDCEACLEEETCTGGDCVSTCSVGASSGGGIVFYSGSKCYVAATSDQSTNIGWGCCCSEIEGADGTSIGTGKQNTADIVTNCTSTGNAAHLCNDLFLNGFSDWYLPSIYELNAMWTSGYFTFLSQYYWSSSEYDDNESWSEHMSTGAYNQGGKNSTVPVRCIRSF